MRNNYLTEGDNLSGENIVKNIGIDFGTTNTVIYSRDQKGKLKKIGGKSTRTAVYFKSRDEYIIGQDALKSAQMPDSNPQALVLNFKPDICEKREIIAENGDRFKLKCEAVAKLFLNQLLTEKVEKRFLKMFGVGEMTEQDKTVITVPAKFNPEQKKKIKRAATNAYFSNVGLAFEPTAAAVAALGTDVKGDIVAVYDFGGGTFDISVIERDADGHFRQIDEDGDRNLGGNDITEAVIEKIIIPVLEENDIEFSMDYDDMEFDESEMTEEEYYYNCLAVRQCGNELKESFSEDVSYEKTLKIIQGGEEIFCDIDVSVEQFENVIRPMIQSTVDITERVIEKVKRQKKYVRKIVMAGGSSNIILAQKMLAEQFENEGIEVILSDEPFDLIAKGALLMAENHRLIMVEEKTTEQFGVGERTASGLTRFQTLISENEVLPVSGSKCYEVNVNMQKNGEIEIPCYERDIKNYPDSQVTRDKGVSYINTYKIAIDRELSPSSVRVEFNIEKDGTLRLSAELLDSSEKVIKKIETDITSDSDIE